MSTATMKIADRFPDVSVLGRTFGFELGFRQLDGGDPGIPATALISENITLTHMRFARRYHVEFNEVHRATISAVDTHFKRRKQLLLIDVRVGQADAVRKRQVLALGRFQNQYKPEKRR